MKHLYSVFFLLMTGWSLIPRDQQFWVKSSLFKLRYFLQIVANTDDIWLSLEQQKSVIVHLISIELMF